MNTISFSNGWMKVLLLVVIFVVLAGGGWVLWNSPQKNSLSTEIQASPTPLPVHLGFVAVKENTFNPSSNIHNVSGAPSAWRQAAQVQIRGQVQSLDEKSLAVVVGGSPVGVLWGGSAVTLVCVPSMVKDSSGKDLPMAQVFFELTKVGGQGRQVSVSEMPSYLSAGSDVVVLVDRQDDRLVANRVGVFGCE